MQSSNDNRNIIFIIAGEASGDQIGADLIYQLKKINKNPIKFVGIGGPKMIKEGLNPIFDMSEISVMGILEVVAKIYKIIIISIFQIIIWSNFYFISFICNIILLLIL